ncbi:hypothetical protein SODALDRAFT_330761 [Sodiomyces alkalinus F11]|uniref:Uncharacterized protein n=1 Tax=Sodiomyces alkalinus (strain CBS 110278 / VKM F-3762 / F11) TaxID=1314773 RepID=A0A3N2Q2T1_SODAK|nr:hypothetical protein SODALDRAFT_330761 [Sodiomyces alkalinus F11]ROT41042.1 hypothetical protein SODALDRAFT_330761 [Sodiomyces alkalinus F11]
MPREGSGHIADNATETGHNIIHGAGPVEESKVSRADKTAPLPEHEKGKGLPGMPASGGQSQGLSQGPSRGQGRAASK